MKWWDQMPWSSFYECWVLRLARECPRVSGRSAGWQWPDAGLGHWVRSVCIGPFDGGGHYLPYLHHSLALGQMTGREHSPALQQNIGLKIYWARPSFLLSQSLPSGSFHRSPFSEGSFPFSEGRQTGNHNHRKLTNLITWTTALSNSVKLWARPCRATQDGRVMVESSDKMWSTGEGNGKPLQYFCLENPMKSMKRQKIIIKLLEFELT